MQELEVRLQNCEADLKASERRIETLQNALKVQEEEFGSGDEDEEDITRSTGSLDDLSSSGGSYRIGEYSIGGEMSDEEDMGATTRYSRFARGVTSSRSATPRADDMVDLGDDYSKPYSRRARANIEEDSKDLFPRRSKGKITPVDDEEDYKPRKSYGKYADEDSDLTTRRRKNLDSDDDEFKSSRSHRSYRKAGDNLSDEDTTGKTSQRHKQSLPSDDEDDLASWRQQRKERIPLSNEDEKDDFKSRRSKEESPTDNVFSTPQRQRHKLSDDDGKKESPSDLLSGRKSDRKKEVPLANGSKVSDRGKASEEDRAKMKQRKESIKELVSEEQEQLYSVAQKRRRRRRTGDAKSTRQAAHDSSAAS